MVTKWVATTIRRMDKTRKNHILQALFKTIVSFASFHLILLVILSVIDGNLARLNLFSILELNEFFPHIERGVVSFSFSIAIILIVYFAFYFRSKR